MPDSFDSKHLGLRVQKKLLGKMATKKIAKAFIDDLPARCLDNLYQLAKDYTGSKKTAEKILKDLIKTVIAIGILYKNEQFDEKELDVIDAFKCKFRKVAMTVVSFHRVDFTFDQTYLTTVLLEVATLLKRLVARRLTAKSAARIDNMFAFVSSSAFLEVLFCPGGPYSNTLDNIVTDMDTMLENNVL